MVISQMEIILERLRKLAVSRPPMTSSTARRPNVLPLRNVASNYHRCICLPKTGGQYHCHIHDW